ncbi:MAG: hypothetical protein IPL27_28745 [Lewinellaceae bacterium]|nr:hypothetical protein [Lewinellaceae bacterium]
MEGYLKTYKNLVKTDPDTYLSNNGGDGYARGIDVFFRDQKTIKRGDYWISYSYLDTKRDYRDFPTSAVPTFAATHNASVVYKHWFSGIKHGLRRYVCFSVGQAFQRPQHRLFQYRSHARLQRLECERQLPDQSGWAFHHPVRFGHQYSGIRSGVRLPVCGGARPRRAFCCPGDYAACQTFPVRRVVY